MLSVLLVSLCMPVIHKLNILGGMKLEYYKSVGGRHDFSLKFSGGGRGILAETKDHTTNNDGVSIDWSLHLEDSSNVQTISWMLHQLMDPREEYLENYRCVDNVKS